jgi:non-canonical poly(A) RNA polymerase PAPD5/7
VTPFGSFYTGLWLPVGDMDISIMDVEGSQILNLKMLTISLARLGIPVAVEVISSARVPIVKYIDSETGISVDLSLNTESAMDTSHFICRQVYLKRLTLLLFNKIIKRALIYIFMFSMKIK